MYLLWDQEPYDYLSDAIAGVKAQTYPKEDMVFLVVYNSFKKGNTSACPYIREQIAAHKNDLPDVHIVEQEENLGFSGGNNLGMQWAIDNNYDYVILHNGDAYMESNTLTHLVKEMENDKTIGAAQPLILLDDNKDQINTAGNKLHFLGVGFGDLYKVNKHTISLPKVKDVGYVSGCAIMMRTDLLQKYGLWDEDYFMYHEDTDYSLRLKLFGYRTVLVSESVFYHKYVFCKNIKNLYWIERNRLALLLLYYKIPTLILIFPIGIFFEISLLLFSIKGKWLKQRLAVYAYWCNPKNITRWLKKRKQIQKTRTISDKVLLQNVVSGIHFQEKAVENPILLYIGNPIMKVYWYIAYRCIFW